MRIKITDLEELAKKLDVSPTMHKYAVERYEGISNYLREQGIDAAFYPQGSFRTGTVTRPLKNNIEADFDIDVVCELQISKNNTNPSMVKTSIGIALKENETYSKKLLPEQDRCWTLTYADVADGIGLKLDVVPCAKEEQRNILILKTKGVQDEYAKKAVVITEKFKTNDYEWLPSNPDGYGAWFDDINNRFLLEDISQRKQMFLNENHNIFAASATIDDVPDYYIKSSLQRIIQLLKRHRDIYYNRIKDGEKLRPISAIITTLVAKIAESATSTEIDSLLSYMVSELHDYSALLQGRTPTIRFFGEKRDYIEKSDYKWKICNPVNPDDNYADAWTDETAKAFFKWIEAVAADLSVPKPENEMQYLTGLKSGLGTSFVESFLLKQNDLPDKNVSIPQVTSTTKPWGV